MVKIDRGFVGVLLIAIVISTIVMGFVTVEKADVGLEIIKNKCPATLKTSVQERHTFVINVIARRDHEEVKLKFAVLRISDPYLADPNVTSREGVTLDEIATEIAPVKTCLSAGKSSPVGFERRILEFNYNGTDVEALLYDFAELVAAGHSVPDMSLAPTTFLIWLDENDELKYFEGSSDFFLNRNESIESLVVSYNDEETTYRSAKEVTGSIDIPTIAEGPVLGTVKYENVRKDDRMYVMFAVNSLSVPEHEGMIQLVRVYGNGELVAFEANAISP
jgi:hypothetical protein